MHQVGTSPAALDEEIAASPVPLLVDVSAEWCGPCKLLTPVLAELAAEYEGRLEVIEVDIEEHPEVSPRWDVMSFPTLLLFDGGELVWRTVGARGKGQLRQELERVLRR